MDLTSFERLTLWHQNEILKHVDPANASQYEMIQDVLKSGYARVYDQVLPHMEEELPDHKAGFVLNVLDMYDALSRVEEKAGKRLEGPFSHFAGFDGHGDLVGFAYFFVKKLERYKALKISVFDAHMAIEQSYERMLSMWLPLGDVTRRFNLTWSDAEQIIAAAPFSASQNSQ